MHQILLSYTNVAFECLPTLQIAIALLNARISTTSFMRWSIPLVLPLMSLMLSKISLIAPLVCV